MVRFAGLKALLDGLSAGQQLRSVFLVDELKGGLELGDKFLDK